LENIRGLVFIKQTNSSSYDLPFALIAADVTYHRDQRPIRGSFPAGRVCADQGQAPHSGMEVMDPGGVGRLKLRRVSP
jgi:hypothetical protein